MKRLFSVWKQYLSNIYDSFWKFTFIRNFLHYIFHCYKTSSAKSVDEIHYQLIIHRTTRNRSKKYQWHGITNYDHDDEYKEEDLNSSVKEKVYNDVAPSGFVLPYFVLRGRLSFIPAMDPSMDRIRLPAAPRRFTRRNAGFHCTESTT